MIDLSKSNLKLFTSNYPIIQGKNIITKNGYDLVFPISPNKALILISKESQEGWKKLKETVTMENLIISINKCLLQNENLLSLPYKYRIFSLEDNINFYLQ